MTKGNRIRLAIADEEPAFRDGLRRLLASESDVCLVGEASDARSAVTLTRKVKPDVVMLDFDLSRHCELQSQDGLASILSPALIIVVVNVIDRFHVVEAIRLGARGIVTRSSNPRVLVESVKSVMSGCHWLGSEDVRILVEALRDFLNQSNGTLSLKAYGLTPRELEIIARIASGCSNREVGQEFSISERTVKHHLTNIFTKIGVSSRLQLALFAVNRQLVNQQAVVQLSQASDGEV